MAAESGRFVFRPGEALHRRLKEKAAASKLSLNRLCVEVLSRSLDEPACLSPEAFEGLNPSLLPATVLQLIVRRWRGEIRAIVLFGSAARGEAWASSDLDLLLVLRPGHRLVRELYTRWDTFAGELGAKWRDRVSPHFVRLPSRPEEAGGLWLEVALDGVILWDADLAAARFLASLRRFIAARGAERRWTQGVPYWVRKERAG